MGSMYDELARYYDLTYASKDYKKESALLHTLIEKHKRSGGRTLLDVACGTGKHLQHLTRWYDCEGCDISADMLAIARSRLPGISFFRADMTKLAAGKQYDVVTCLFSAIGYVRTYKNLEKTIRSFAEHLRTGGVVIIEPWFDRDTFFPNTAHMQTYDAKGIKIARVSYSRLERGISRVDFDYSIAEDGKGLLHVRDNQLLGLFEPRRMLAIMEKYGLRASHVRHQNMKGRKIYVGVKR